MDEEVDHGPVQVVEWSQIGVVLVGFGSGMLSGLFGIGGAGLTTPGVRLFGASPVAAIGSTVPPVLPSALSGTLRFARAGLVNWRIGLVCGLSGSVLAVAGARLADLVNPHLLMVATAVLLGISGVTLARRGDRAPSDEPLVDDEVVIDGAPGADAEITEPPGAAGGTGVALAVRPSTVIRRQPGADDLAAPPATTRTPVSTVALLLVGAASGLLAGVLGVGGGIVMMPAFTKVLKLPMREAIASSLVAVAILSVPAAVAHTMLGHVDWGLAALLVLGGIPGARLGSRLTVRAPEATVRIAFGTLLVLMAIGYGVVELAALRG
jgi:uncharacterized membrane protein YfcA